MLAEAAQAGLWGAFAGAALLLGAAVAWFVRVPPRLVSAIMAFGFAAGAVAYSAANAALARQGARHRKRSGGQQQSESESESGSGSAAAERRSRWAPFSTASPSRRSSA